MYSTPPPRPGRNASPQIKSPYSCKPFLSDASSSAVAVPEQPEVQMEEWWLSTVEGHEGKISVGGYYRKGRERHEFIAAPIAKRHEPCTLETEDGILVFLDGYFNCERTRENGFSFEACKGFCIGFPYWWDEWKVYCPNIMSLQTGSQPRSSRTSNSCEDSTVPSASTLGSTNDESKVGIDKASHINNGCQKKTSATLVRQQAGEGTDVSSSEKNGKEAAGNQVQPESTKISGAVIKKGRGRPIKWRRKTEVEHGDRKPKLLEGKIRGKMNENAKEAVDDQVQPESTKINSVVVMGGRRRPRKAEIELVDINPKLLDGKIRGKMNEGNQSPVTLGSVSSLSISTPESLKLKKTKSGRVIVPTLVSGCQNIVYARDGSIRAIVGLESPPELKGNTRKVYARKKKRTR